MKKRIKKKEGIESLLSMQEFILSNVYILW